MDVKVVRYLLANDAALLAVVPADRIMAGSLTQELGLPAVSIKHVSALRGKDVALGASRLRTARVQVTVVAKSYDQQKDVLRLVIAALPHTRGLIAGVDVDSIIPALEGPDLEDVATGLYMQSYDVMVTHAI